MATSTAFLDGTYSRPVLWLRFDRGARHLRTNVSLIEWVKMLPARRWNPDRGMWWADGVGLRPTRELKRAGFRVDVDSMATHESLADVSSLEELVDPVVKLSKDQPGTALVRARLGGFDEAVRKLGPGLMWEKGKGRFRVTVADLVDAAGDAKLGVEMSDRAVRAGRAARAVRVAVADTSTLSGAPSLAAAGEKGAAALRAVGDVPDWFGFEPYEYQRAGSIGVAAGARMLADDMGIGKTISALAAHSIAGTRRLVVTTPPVALTQWERTTEGSGMFASGTVREGVVVVISAGRKQPELPTGAGAVVVSDSLLASRPQLLADLVEWAPDGLIVDEIHRHRTLNAQRTVATQRLARATSGVRTGLSGTPMMSNPVELVAPLTITGQMEAVFGSQGDYMERYARQTPFGSWVARKRRLPELRRIFDEQVWIRRRKEDVLDLPKKVRRAMFVDVDLKEFRRAHRDVKTKVKDWLDEFRDEHDRFPTEGEVTEYARGAIELLSLMRRAAGLAKVEPAAEYVADWVASSGTGLDDEGRVTYDRPLVVWTHHRAVSDAMAAAVPDLVGGARVIKGGTSKVQRTQVVDDFQEGLVPVLIASITAAGTGITLTRSSDALFVETDWTPALVQQAEDRIYRIGSPHPVMVSTMIAPGTLDERVQSVLSSKSDVLTPMMGVGQDVSVAAAAESLTEPWQIIAGIVEELLPKRERDRRRTEAKTRSRGGAGLVAAA